MKGLSTGLKFILDGLHRNFLITETFPSCSTSLSWLEGADRTYGFPIKKHNNCMIGTKRSKEEEKKEQV
jgi:hypothetical protein